MLRVLQCGGGSGHRSFREALHPHRTTVSMLRYETSFVFLLVPVPLLYNLQCRVPVVPVPVTGTGAGTGSTVRYYNVVSEVE